MDTEYKISKIQEDINGNTSIVSTFYYVVVTGTVEEPIIDRTKIMIYESTYPPCITIENIYQELYNLVSYYGTPIN